MSIAAVPQYLGTNFKEASIGLKFGLYLKIWTNEEDQRNILRERAKRKSPEAERIRNLISRFGEEGAIEQLNKENSRIIPLLWSKKAPLLEKDWNEIKSLSPEDCRLIKSLITRQKALASLKANNELLKISAICISPFTTGLGNEHPLENGFAFLWPYGLPYLAGSGVKGVLRKAAEELASRQWGDSRGWSTEKAYSITVGKENIELSMLDVLFGLESGDGGKEHVRGVLSFWDVIPDMPDIGGQKALMLEIMTPHQSHYYMQQDKDYKQQDSEIGCIPPHESGKPNPIIYLTVPPGSRFEFHVLCERSRLLRLTKNKIKETIDLNAEENGKPIWQILLELAFEHAFQWLGFGAKTSIGYGAMQRDSQNVSSSPRQESFSDKRSVSKEVDIKTEDWPNATLKYIPQNKEIVAFFGDKKTAPCKNEKVDQIFKSLGDDLSAKLKKKKEITINAKVKQEGNKIELIEVKPCSA